MSNIMSNIKLADQNAPGLLSLFDKSQSLRIVLR